MQKRSLVHKKRHFIDIHFIDSEMSHSLSVRWKANDDMVRTRVIRIKHRYGHYENRRAVEDDA